MLKKSMEKAKNKLTLKKMWTHLAEKPEHPIEHPELWSEMGRYGREFVEKYYDIRRLNKRLVEIYQNLIRKENNNDSGRG